MNPKGVLPLVGALIIAAIATFELLHFGERWWKWGMGRGLGMVLLAGGVVALGLRGWTRHVRSLYGNVREEFDAPAEPVSQQCIQCRKRFPSRYYFGSSDPRICSSCSGAPN